MKTIVSMLSCLMVLTSCGGVEVDEDFEYVDHQFVRFGEALRLEDSLGRSDGGKSYSAHAFRLDGSLQSSEVTFVKKSGSIVCMGGRGLLRRPRIELTNGAGDVLSTSLLRPEQNQYALAFRGESADDLMLRLVVEDDVDCSFALNFEIQS